MGRMGQGRGGMGGLFRRPVNREQNRAELTLVAMICVGILVLVFPLPLFYSPQTGVSKDLLLSLPLFAVVLSKWSLEAILHHGKMMDIH